MCKITKFHSNTVTVTLTKLYHIKQDHFIVNFYILPEKCKKSQYLCNSMTISKSCSTVMQHRSLVCTGCLKNLIVKIQDGRRLICFRGIFFVIIRYYNRDGRVGFLKLHLRGTFCISLPHFMETCHTTVEIL